MDEYHKLPINTLVYCGHEYTESNLKFALSVEPNNQDIQNKLTEIQKLRQSDLPSLPSILETEKKINPFMRCRELSVIKAAEIYSSRSLQSASEVLGEIRNWKDSF